MKAIQFILFTALICLLCASSCKENEVKVWTELPPKTQTGANTMGCLVDGKLWATGKLPGSFKFPAMSARYLDYGEYVHLNFHAQGNVGRIAFVVKNPYIGQNEAKVSCSFDIYSECYVMTDSTKNLIITKMDLEKGILSGNFTFDIPCKKDADKILHITEGRFDLRMSVYK